MPGDRIRGWSDISVFIDSGTPVQVPFVGSPWSTIKFDPFEGSLALFVESTAGVGATPPPVDISVAEGALGQRRGWTISTRRRDLFFHFYCFVCALTDELIDNERSLEYAFDTAVRGFRDLIERESVLSPEKQIGFLAELLVLEALGLRRDWGWCLDAWHDESNAEHDFNLGSTDLEVKATLNETRRHMIGSLHQLEPSVGRPLFLVSFQFTRNDHDSSIRLPVVYQRVLALISASSPASIERYTQRANLIGYKEEHERFYSTGYSFRTTPLAFAVGGPFPRLVPSHLALPDPGMAPRISQVSYRIDLEGLEGEPLDAHLDTHIGGPNA